MKHVSSHPYLAENVCFHTLTLSEVVWSVGLQVAAPEGDYAWDLNDPEDPTGWFDLHRAPCSCPICQENLVLGMWGRGGKLTTCVSAC